MPVAWMDKLEANGAIEAVTGADKLFQPQLLRQSRARRLVDHPGT